MSDDISRTDEIVTAIANGAPLRAVARSHDMTVDVAREIIDAEAACAFGGEELRRQWLLESRRLEALGALYYAKAMEGDGNSALIYRFISRQARGVRHSAA